MQRCADRRAQKLVNAWLEDWEKGLLTTDEKKDSTARFRMLNKTRGLRLRDVDPTYDEHREVSFCYPFACCLLNPYFFALFDAAVILSSSVLACPGC